ncbi:MAG: hypothetical protein IAG13_20530, partial [Deltaproteobacteria bacterium]|nr:hypothetical protein [Nannocystaceae bacterium]
MASPSIFSMRVVRCPACGARLPVQTHLAMLRCEYCDARVELERMPPQQPSLQQPGPPRMPGPPVHVARPQYSRFALIVLLLPVLLAGAGAFTAFRAVQLGETTTAAAIPSTPLAAPRALTADARTVAPTPASPLASV